MLDPSAIELELETLTGFAVTSVNITGGVVTAVATNPADQAAIDAAIPQAVQNVEDADAAHAANQAALADMIGTFVVSADAIAYFNALQQEIRNVSNNNSIVIGTVFPAMRTLLQDDGTTGLYERYLNILRVSAGINQATFEGSPTTAQQHNAFTIAQNFANTGMIQMIAGVLFG